MKLGVWRSWKASLLGLCACGAVARSPLPSPPRTGPIRLETSSGIVELAVIGPSTVRVRLLRERGTQPPPSFAVDAPAKQDVPYTREETSQTLTLRTSELAVRVTNSPLRVALLDAAGAVISEEAAPIAWHHDGFTESWVLPDKAHVYGLGDKARGGLDRRGQTFEMWNTDAYGWKPDSDPLYKTIPFAIFLRAGRAHGLFFDTPTHATVDVGALTPGRFSYAVEAGDALDLYLFGGPDPKRVVSAFTALTGRTPLPPRWALGYHQSRYSYLTETEANEVAAHLRHDSIPTDALWLDIDYQQKNAPFTVDSAAFPNFPKFVAGLREQGMRTVVITDPHIKSYLGEPMPSGYAPYDSGSAGDHFIHERIGGPFAIGKVWPGESVFPEFTLTRTRAWWGTLYRDFVNEGVAGFWNDMNEPALFNDSKTLPSATPHRLDDGTVLDHTRVHNAYGALNARATYEGLRALRPNERPFVLTRAAYAGAQRYAASWTGDNSATREHLALSIAQLANLGVSGYAFVGADVGGFVGCPDPDLFAAWVELGALQPFFRNHSAKDACRREPWVFGAEVEERVRAAIERRYRLLPYLYTAFADSAQSGLPVLRPLWLDFPDEESLATDASSFLLGSELLVAPRLAAGNGSYRVTLPQAPWFDTVTGELHEHGGDVELPASTDSVRLFARAGAIIPSAPVVQHTGVAPEGPLQLDVWPGKECRGSLYLDDGETFAHERGQFRRISYECQITNEGVRVSARSLGDYAPWWQSTKVVIHGLSRAPRNVSGSSDVTLEGYDAKIRATLVNIRGNAADWQLTLQLGAASR